jgi:hypothetical protein
MVRGVGLLPAVVAGACLTVWSGGCGELGRLRLKWSSGRLLGGDVLESPIVADMGGLLARV